MELLILVAEVSTGNQTQEYPVSMNNVTTASAKGTPLYLHGHKLPLLQKDSAYTTVNHNCLMLPGVN